MSTTFSSSVIATRAAGSSDSREPGAMPQAATSEPATQDVEYPEHSPPEAGSAEPVTKRFLKIEDVWM